MTKKKEKPITVLGKFAITGLITTPRANVDKAKVRTRGPGQTESRVRQSIQVAGVTETELSKRLQRAVKVLETGKDPAAKAPAKKKAPAKPKTETKAPEKAPEKPKTDPAK